MEEKSELREAIYVLTQAVASQELSQTEDIKQLSHVLSKLSQLLAADTELVAD